MITIPATIISVPTPSSGLNTGAANSLKAADKILDRIMHKEELLTTLADQSSTYVPPNKTGIMSVLWAAFNPDAGSFLSKSSVEKAVLSSGGSSMEFDAIWRQINPSDKGSVSVGDFSDNPYLTQAVISNIDTIAEATNKTREANAAKENFTGILDFLAGKGDNVLSNFTGGTGTVLDLFS